MSVLVVARVSLALSPLLTCSPEKEKNKEKMGVCLNLEFGKTESFIR